MEMEREGRRTRRRRREKKRRRASWVTVGTKTVVREVTAWDEQGTEVGGTWTRGQSLEAAQPTKAAVIRELCSIRPGSYALVQAPANTSTYWDQQSPGAKTQSMNFGMCFWTSASLLRPWVTHGGVCLDPFFGPPPPFFGAPSFQLATGKPAWL
jgi:hypothetical protein